MKYYSLELNIAGDRNHVITKHKVSTPEVLLLQSIHGNGSVYNVRPFKQEGIDRTPEAVTKEFLGKVYRKTKLGSGNDVRPALVQVFPGWPNVKLPTDLKDTTFDEAFMKPAKDEADPDREAALQRAREQEEKLKREQEEREAALEAEQAEAEAKAKEEAEAKAQADAEAAAKAEAEAKAKAEAEKKAKAGGSKTTQSGGKKTADKKDDEDEFLE